MLRSGIVRYLILLLFLFGCNPGFAQYVIHIAGNDSCGHFGDGGPATVASLRGPAGICRDNAGNLYIGDGSTTGENDARVRKVDAVTGIITTIAGGVHLPSTDTGENVPATSVAISYTGGMCIDRAGNLLIADGPIYRLKKVKLATGIITTIAGTGSFGYGGDGGSATAAQLVAINDVTVDTANNIYIANGCTVRKITAATGIITTVAGIADTAGFRGDGGAATSALLKTVRGVYVDHSGNIFISDADNFRIRMVSAATGIITTVAGIAIGYSYSGDGGPATAAGLFYPVRTTKDSAGNLYISDLKRIRKITSATGIITTVAGNGMRPPGYIDSVGDGGPATAAIVGPYGICFDNCGNLYFADEGCRIRAITPETPAIRICDTATISAIAAQQANVENQALQVYPNPNYGSFTISLSAQTTEQVQVVITNIVGQTIKETTILTNQKMELLLGAPPGTYFINTSTSRGRYNAKVMVQ